MVNFYSKFSQAKKVLAAAVLALVLAPASASAITLVDQGNNVQTGGVATGDINLSGSIVTGEWDDTAGGGNLVRLYQSFTATRYFNLTVTDYNTSVGSSVSGLRLLTGIKTSGTSGTIFNTNVNTSSVPSTFGVFGPGTYTVRLVDFGPGDGDITIEFEGAVAVPLPAGMGLMLTALGGLALVNRRRQKKAEAA